MWIASIPKFSDPSFATQLEGAVYYAKGEFGFLRTLSFKVLYFLKMLPILVGSVHNFSRSDNDTI